MEYTVSCSHVESCPLFPKLRRSLETWRDNYCCSDTGWQECARFKASTSGRPVPITLLPNGASIGISQVQAKTAPSERVAKTVEAPVATATADPAEDEPQASIWGRFMAWLGGGS